MHCYQVVAWDSMDLQERDRLLWGIRELREQNYVGFQDAWRIVTFPRRFRKIAEETAADVNRELELWSGVPSYPATPSRVVALEQGFFEGYLDALSETDNNEQLAKIQAVAGPLLRSLDDFPESLTISRASFYTTDHFETLPFTSLFSEANAAGIHDESQWGDILQAMIEKEYATFQSLLPPGDKEPAERYVRSLTAALAGRDWRKAMSPRQYERVMGKAQHDFMVHTLWPDDMANRLHHDGLHRNYELRRMVLAGYLTNMRSGGVTTYADAIKYVNKRVETLEQSFQSVPAPFSEGRLRNARYLQDAVSRERSWVAAFLRH